MCAKCMYEMYMAKGIIPQTKEVATDQGKLRSNSETKHANILSKEEMDRKIQKEMIIAKHVGNPMKRNEITKKSNLIAAAQKTISGHNYKPTMKPKQNNLTSNFASLSGATSFLDSNDPDLIQKLLNSENPKNELSDLKPDFPVPTSQEEHGWAPFQNLNVDR